MRGQERGGAGRGGGRREGLGKEELEVERSGVLRDLCAHTFRALSVAALDHSRPQVSGRPRTNSSIVRFPILGSRDGKDGGGRRESPSP